MTNKIKKKVTYFDKVYNERKYLEELFYQHDYKYIEASLFEDFETFTKSNPYVETKDLMKTVLRNGQVVLLRPDITSRLIELLGWKESSESEKLFYYTKTYSYNKFKISEERQFGIEFLKEKTDLPSEIFILLNNILKRYKNKSVLELGSELFIKTLMKEAKLSKSDYKLVLSALRDKDLYLLKGVLSKYENNQLLSDIFSINGTLNEIISTLSNYELSTELLNALEDIKQANQVCKDLDLDYKFDLSLVSPYEYYNGLLFNVFIEDSNKALIKGGNYDVKSNLFDGIGFVVDLDELVKKGELK